MITPDPHESDRQFLAEADLEVVGRLVDASNATLYCQATTADRIAHCVYKPISGERPLWDFPDGTLAGREVAAYAVSQATGWGFIPPTIFRSGPFGEGMVQLWQDGDDSVDILGMIRSEPHSLRLLSVLDAVINNADRKGGHLIARELEPGQGEQERWVWAVDHGVCFSIEDKLRTLLWMWAGERLPDDALEVLADLAVALDDELGDVLCEHLTVREVRETARRVDELLATERHPEPNHGWPAIPYPPF